jgi:hypothetical protein
VALKGTVASIVTIAAALNPVRERACGDAEVDISTTVRLERKRYPPFPSRSPLLASAAGVPAVVLKALENNPPPMALSPLPIVAMRTSREELEVRVTLEPSAAEAINAALTSDDVPENEMDVVESAVGVDVGARVKEPPEPRQDPVEASDASPDEQRTLRIATLPPKPFDDDKLYATPWRAPSLFMFADSQNKITRVRENNKQKLTIELRSQGQEQW